MFLHRCLRGRWFPDALPTPADGVDWDALVHAAHAGGASPLLYHTLRGRNLLPPSAEEALRIDYYANARRNLFLFRELAGLLTALSAAGVDVLLLKGAALAEAVYDNPAVRPMGDLDLLVREARVPDALRVLSGLGYAITPPAAYRNEIVLQKHAAVGVILELHWQLFVSPAHHQTIPADWLWDTALPVQVEGAPAWILGPEAQILHLCGHLVLHHDGEAPRTIWLHDVAEVIALYHDRIDWENVLARAQAYGLLGAVQNVVGRVVDDWQAPVPPGVQARLRTLRPSPAEGRVQNWLVDAHTSGAHRFLADLRSISGIAGRFRFLWRNLFPPPGYVRYCYGVRHAALVPLYYPYRWLKGMFGALRRSKP